MLLQLRKNWSTLKNMIFAVGKTRPLQNAKKVFSGNKSDQEQIQKLESEKDDLHRQIGEQAMDNAYLKKNLKKLGLM